MKVAATLLSSAVAMLVVLQLRDRARFLGPTARGEEGVYSVPSPDWLPALSLGHREAFADLLWMRGLVYYGSELGSRGDALHVLDYVDAVVALDPYFVRAYVWAGTGGVYRHGATAADVERAVRLMERGHELFPRDGELAWNIGATLAYELPAYLTDAAAREDAKRRAQPYLEAAAQLGAGPDWLVLTNATQDVRLGERSRAIAHLEAMYSVVRDPDVKAQILAQLASLRSAEEAAAFDAAARDFAARRAREYPYLDDGLYLFVQPREVPPR